ncbi:MAG: hypothetical protein ACI9TV_002809 [Sulfurimonas sp.]|uniref:hypothetical protein n=1 Tax=Sulfurimonas sp. TaxID=2022749 RepID=UPI0039E41C4E
MKDLHENKKLFDATYSPNTERARKEMTKSVFIAPSPSDIRVFNYRSAYEITDQASLIKCSKNDISHDEAIEEATQQLTGLSSKDYSKKIDELFLEKEGKYREIDMIWENFNFPTPDLNFSDFPNYGGLDISRFKPENMLKNGLNYIQDASIFNLRIEKYEEAFFSFDDFEEFLSCFDTQIKRDDETYFLEYMNYLLQKKEKLELKPETQEEMYYRAAKAIGISDSNLNVCISTWKKLVLHKILAKENFAQKMLYSYWNFQKKMTTYRIEYKQSSVLYYGKYAKDYVNIYEDNFFRNSEEYNNDMKYGVSIWAELNTDGLESCKESSITNSKLSVVFAKSYIDGSTQTIATLDFDYIICFYKKEKNGATYASRNDDILAVTGNDIYTVLSQQFYPLLGISKGEGILELMKQFTIDEGERGGVLNLRDINISSKYSDKIIPELIKGIYHLVTYNSPSSFPLFSCMVDGDIIVNDELFPVIKSPLLTVVSSNYLIQRIRKVQEDKSKQDSYYSDFFSEYNGNAHHYYNNMTFDPLRPILVY